ncbi:hypothetical protein GCM10010297_46330 [Streptomyces malachitofuscus]|nr:hypothetical protein GCM10010297_46330 [Streptomyces malachitofuscus]
MQGSYSSNDSPRENSGSVEIEGIARASLDELEALANQSDRWDDDWQVWEMVRDLSVGRMRNADLDEETQLRWCRLALAALRRKRSSAEFDSASILADEVYVRVFAVQHFGAVYGDPVQDPIEVCRSVFIEIHESRADVAAATAEWRSLSKSEILRLRRIKNLLTRLRPIADCIPREAPQHQQLSEWLQLIPRLP